MKIHKKLLVLVVTLAMLCVSLLQPATVGAFVSDSQICASIGLLKGEGEGVSAGYLAKPSSRLQSAIIYLRLIGKESAALSYSGSANFTDAGQVTWQEGKNILAYLKANPQLGWIGLTDGSFKPNEKTTAQAMHKVLLEALGYKQGVDFTWDNVISYAKIIGFSKTVGASPFINGNIASSLVEALKLIPKGSFIAPLVQKLVNANVIIRDDAIKAGFSIAKPPATLLKFSLLYPLGSQNWKKALIWQDLMKKANVDIELIDNAGSYDEKLSVLYASGQCPDVFSSSGKPEYEQNGTARITIGDFKKYMPLSYESTMIAMDSLNLNIANTWKPYYIGGPSAYATYNESNKIFGTPGVWYQAALGHGSVWRQDLLTELGYSAPPDTIAGYEAVFAKYKAKYPDKFAYSTNKEFVRQFDMVFGAAGAALGRWMKSGSNMSPGWLQPGVRQALEVVARWYKLGYINKEYLTVSSIGDLTNFNNGNTILVDWSEYNHYAAIEQINDGKGAKGTLFETLYSLYPKAKLVAGPFPTMDPSIKPALNCWKPFTGIGCGYARKLERNPSRLHAIMSALDYMAQTPELAIEAAVGIEGVTYKVVDNQIQFIGAYTDVAARAEAGLGLGGWQCFQPVLLEEPFYPKYVTIATNKYFLNDDALYNSSRIAKWPRFSGGIYDEQGVELTTKYADLINEREALFAGIISGKRPITDFDKYMEKWRTSGGAELEKACTRLYGPLIDAQ